MLTCLHLYPIACCGTLEPSLYSHYNMLYIYADLLKLFLQERSESGVFFLYSKYPFTQIFLWLFTIEKSLSSILLICQNTFLTVLSDTHVTTSTYEKFETSNIKNEYFLLLKAIYEMSVIICRARPNMLTFCISCHYKNFLDFEARNVTFDYILPCERLERIKRSETKNSLIYM